MMDKLRIVLVFLTLSAVLPGCGVDPCRNESSLSLDGYVEDSDGRPMPGVKIYGHFNPKEGIRPQPACSTRTDAAGHYRMSFGCHVEEFVVIPTRPGCVFSPGSRFWRPAHPLEGYDFRIYCGEGYLVDGHVWMLEGPGHPASGITVRIQSSSASRWDETLTDEDGYYVFQDLYPVFEYEIMPFHTCIEFEPVSRIVRNPAEDHHNQDFTVVTDRFVYVRGHIRDPYGTPLEGVTVSFTYIGPHGRPADAPDSPQPEIQFEVETDHNGFYQIHTTTCVCVSVQPHRLGCHAVPYMRAYSPSYDLDGQDYTLFCGEGYTVSGYLTADDGEPIPHAAVRISSSDFGSFEVESDVAGYYEFSNLPWGLDYEVRPNRCPAYCDCTPPPAGI